MTFLIIFHTIICIMLGIIILMQAGRKGGLTEAFASTESMLGTKTNSFMVTATTIFCVLFFVTSLILAVLSSQKSKSLMTDAAVKPASVSDEVSKDVDAVKQDAAAAVADAKDAVKAAVDQTAQDAAQAVESVDKVATEAAKAVVETTNDAVEQGSAAVENAGQAVNSAVEGSNQQQPAVPVQ